VRRLNNLLVKANEVVSSSITKEATVLHNIITKMHKLAIKRGDLCRDEMDQVIKHNEENHDQ
jgi:hypothetical protein